jgi:hypothetical protein
VATLHLSPFEEDFSTTAGNRGPPDWMLISSCLLSLAVRTKTPNFLPPSRAIQTLCPPSTRSWKTEQEE